MKLSIVKCLKSNIFDSIKNTNTIGIHLEFMVRWKDF